MYNGLAGLSETWKGPDQKTGGKEIWARGVWIDLSECTENVRIGILCECLQKQLKQRRSLVINQADKMISFSGISYPLSLDTLVLAQWAYKYSAWGWGKAMC